MSLIKSKYFLTSILYIGFALILQPVVIAQQDTSIEDPPVPFTLGLGMEKFQTLCIECHGKWAEGTEQGPPLIHRYYEPGHHGDQAFYRAILQGSPAHHWQFGDMAPVPGATMLDAAQITEFIRWLQQYKGLY